MRCQNFSTNLRITAGAMTLRGKNGKCATQSLNILPLDHIYLDSIRNINYQAMNTESYITARVMHSEYVGVCSDAH